MHAAYHSQGEENTFYDELTYYIIRRTIKRVEGTKVIYKKKNISNKAISPIPLS
jgi:hypothetical protein